MTTRYVLWTPHEKGNQCVVDAKNLVQAIQAAIQQVGFFADDWRGHRLDATNAKWQARILQESQILVSNSSNPCGQMPHFIK